jgi:hypothetical protein
VKKLRELPADFWWQSLASDFDKVIREFLRRAQKAEVEQTGHECGHRFEITVRSSLHASGPGEHADANYYTDMRPVEVRAHNLRDALLLAAALPLSDYLEQEEDE